MVVLGFGCRDTNKTSMFIIYGQIWKFREEKILLGVEIEKLGPNKISLIFIPLGLPQVMREATWVRIKTARA